MQDVSKYKDVKFDVGESAYRKQINQGKKVKATFLKPNEDVLEVARFIASIEPGYENSKGDLVTLSTLRSLNPQTLVENLDFMVGKLSEVVSPFIRVTKNTREATLVYHIDTKMSKKNLVSKAIEHLLIGSQVVAEPEVYHLIKAYSMYKGEGIAMSLSIFIGIAIAGNYKSVPALFDDLVLQFIDQSEALTTGRKAYYYHNGSVRMEMFV